MVYIEQKFIETGCLITPICKNVIIDRINLQLRKAETSRVVLQSVINPKEY